MIYRGRTFHRKRIVPPLRNSARSRHLRVSVRMEPPMQREGPLSDFEQSVLPHLNAAYNLARWLVRDPCSAEDVVQDALVRAWKYFASCRRASARAWLLRIVRNVAYSRIKAQG